MVQSYIGLRFDMLQVSFGASIYIYTLYIHNIYIYILYIYIIYIWYLYYIYILYIYIIYIYYIYMIYIYMYIYIWIYIYIYMYVSPSTFGQTLDSCGIKLLFPSSFVDFFWKITIDTKEIRPNKRGDSKCKLTTKGKYRQSTVAMENWRLPRINGGFTLW